MKKRHLLCGLLLTLPLIAAQDDCADECDSDADGDGVCDIDDICEGSDDTLDMDIDGVPDGCDICPTDPGNDANADGICDDAPALSLLGMPDTMAVLQRSDADLCPLQIQVENTDINALTLRIYKDGQLSNTLHTDGSQGLSLETTLEAGLHDYQLQLDTLVGGVPTRIATANHVACGDIIFIQGQSNAVAGDYWAEGLANAKQSHWIRSWGSSTTNSRTVQWDQVWDRADGEAFGAHAAIGAWGLELAHQLMTRHTMPMGLLNGAVGGTTVLQHQRNDTNPEDLNTIYGRMLWRANQSGMADDAKYLVWYQGESDGIGDAQAYTQNFEALKADWHADFPSLEDIYLFQVRMGCGFDYPMDATLKLQFLDANGTEVGQGFKVLLAQSDWYAFGQHIQAPETATHARIELGGIGYFGVHFDDIFLLNSAGEQLLENPSFETGQDSPDAWTVEGGGFYTWESGHARTGDRHVRLEAGPSAIYLSQTVPVTAGENHTFYTFARHEYTQLPYKDVRQTLLDLAQNHDDLTLMSTTGTTGHDGCHFYHQGYEQLGQRMADLIGKDHYGEADIPGLVPAIPQSAHFVDAITIRIEMQPGAGPLTVEPDAQRYFYLEGAEVGVAIADGEDLILTLTQPTDATTISYLGHYFDGPFIVGPRGVGMSTFMGLTLE